MSHAYNLQSNGGDMGITWGNEVTSSLGRVTNDMLYPFMAGFNEAHDLSGAAVTEYLLVAERACTMYKALLVYVTEATSADAGITVEIGKISDRNYYYTGATEISKAVGYIKEVTLLQTDIAANDAVTFYSPGGKTGIGELIVWIRYGFTL